MNWHANMAYKSLCIDASQKAAAHSLIMPSDGIEAVEETILVTAVETVKTG